ncbi:hypothetical protein HMN09_00760200 [Mycena chlorophos]|uniref:Ricin B lectin domain-containing protein n=1 Tax=Mycena chlorophos TaxID=658473 RepID=A0A8H6SVI5_MYCCL|nr:hypothetical protein HMN09_00760200 [Mycena chlorophos]
MFKFTILAVSLASLTLEASAAAIPRQQQTFFAESEPVSAVPGHLAIVKDDGSTKYLLANSDGTFDASPDAYTPILLTPNNNGTQCSMQINNSTSTAPTCLQYLGSSQQPTALTYGNCNNATMTYMFAYNSASGEVEPEMGAENTRRGLSTVALKFISDSPKQQQAVSASNASMSSSASSASLSSMALSSASSMPSSSSDSASAPTLSQMLAEAAPSSSGSTPYPSANVSASTSNISPSPVQSSMISASSASSPSNSLVAAQAEPPTATTTATVYVSSSSASASPSLLNAQAAFSSSSILNASPSTISSASASLLNMPAASESAVPSSSTLGSMTWSSVSSTVVYS